MGVVVQLLEIILVLGRLLVTRARNAQLEHGSIEVEAIGEGTYAFLRLGPPPLVEVEKALPTALERDQAQSVGE